MNRVTRFVALTAVAVAFLGCESRTDKVDGGGVLLSVSDFDGLPFAVDVSDELNPALGTPGLVTIGSITIQNVVKDPFGASSDLMNVELQSYEVRFTRADTGSATPPGMVQSIFGVVPVGGTLQLDNYPFMRPDQFSSLPISDLADYGYERATGSTVVRLNVTISFFGRTLSGDPVATAPASFTIDVLP